MPDLLSIYAQIEFHAGMVKDLTAQAKRMAEKDKPTTSRAKRRKEIGAHVIAKREQLLNKKGPATVNS